MSLKRLAVVGAGKMGQAFLTGFQNSSLHQKYEIVSSCRSDATKRELEKKYGGPVFLENRKASENTEILILGVKPFILESVLKEISDKISDKTIVISLAAGITLEQIHKIIPQAKNLVRVMPNLPATLQKGVLVYATSLEMDPEKESQVEELLLLLGKTFKVPERLMDAAAALSGGAPAYVAYFLDAMTQAGVQLGFAADQSFEMVLESFRGSCELFESRKDLRPTQLIREVCTPGGTTIEGMGVLDQGSVKGSILKAVNTAAQKSAFLGGRKLFTAEIPRPPKPSKLPKFPAKIGTTKTSSVAVKKTWVKKSSSKGTKKNK